MSNLCKTNCNRITACCGALCSGCLCAVFCLICSSCIICFCCGIIGYDLQFVDCDNDSAVQLEAVRGFIEQDVDYIIIDPIVSTGWDTVLTECEEAGIPVIVIDRTIDDSDKYVSWVGSNFKTEGLAAGEWLKAYTDAKGISDVMYL